MSIVQQVLTIPNMRWIAITPDGTTVYYTTSAPTNQLYSVPLDGSQLPTMYSLKLDDGTTDAAIYVFTIDPSGTYLIAPSNIPGPNTGLFRWSLASLASAATVLVSSGVDFGNIAITNSYVYYVTAPIASFRRVNYGSGPFTATTLYTPSGSPSYNAITVDSTDQTLYAYDNGVNIMKLTFATSTFIPILTNIAGAVYAMSLLNGSLYYNVIYGSYTQFFQDGTLLAGALTGPEGGNGGPGLQAVFLNSFCFAYLATYGFLIADQSGLRSLYIYPRPYPTPPPPPQQSVICLDRYPIPNSSKKPVYTFNRREFWSWGANRVGNNCVQGDTIMGPSS